MAVIPHTLKEQLEQERRLVEASYGLAQVKPEGYTVNLNTGESHETTPEELQAIRDDKSRWIELHYDADDIAYDSITDEIKRFTDQIDALLQQGYLGEESTEQLITYLASKYINDSGY